MPDSGTTLQPEGGAVYASNVSVRTETACQGKPPETPLLETGASAADHPPRSPGAGPGERRSGLEDKEPTQGKDRRSGHQEGHSGPPWLLALM